MTRTALFLFSLAMLAACSREADPQPEVPAERPIAGLPPATSIGARTGGALFNGTPWAAESDVFEYPVIGMHIAGNILYLELNRNLSPSDQHSKLVFHVPGVRGPGRYPLVARVLYPEGDEYHGVYFRDLYTKRTYTPEVGSLPGELIVTKLDLNAGIASGRFHFRLPHPSGELVVTEGRFDTTIDIDP